MPLPSIYPLILKPTEDSYREARSRLLMQHLLGDPDAAAVLERLPKIYHFLSNFEYYAVLYGSERATRKLISMLSAVRSEPKDRVTMLLELYKSDNAFLESLVDALLELKLKMVERGAPDNLQKLFDETIAMADASKKTSFIRRVQILLSYVRMFEESGPEQVSRAIDILLNRPTSPAPAAAPVMPQMKPPSDSDSVDLLKYIADSNASGVAPSRDDVINYFSGNAVRATAAINRLKSGTSPKVLFDRDLRGYIVSPYALKVLKEDGLMTLKTLRRVARFISSSLLVQKMVNKGVFKPPLAYLAGSSQKEVSEDEEEGED